MPLQITRPTRDIGHIKVSSQADNLCNDLADLAQGALQSYTPNRWKRLLYKAVSAKAKIQGGYGVGGPTGPNGLLPDPVPAPKGMIADFLHRHPEFLPENRLRSGVETSRNRRQYVRKGKPFPKAWSSLPREAKELLKEERLAGMYHSLAPSAPYWLIAEGGMESVGVPAINYLRNSRGAVQKAVPALSARMWDAL